MKREAEKKREVYLLQVPWHVSLDGMRMLTQHGVQPGDKLIFTPADKGTPEGQVAVRRSLGDCPGFLLDLVKEGCAVPLTSKYVGVTEALRNEVVPPPPKSRPGRKKTSVLKLMSEG